MLETGTTATADTTLLNGLHFTAKIDLQFIRCEKTTIRI